MQFIGISGKAGSGKDTLAAQLVDYYSGDYKIARMGFADPMKDWVGHVFDWDNNVLYGPSHLRNRPDWRSITKDMGRTEATLRSFKMRLDGEVQIDPRNERERYRDGVDFRFRFWERGFVLDLLEWADSETIDRARKSLAGWFRTVEALPYWTPRKVLQTLGTQWGRNCVDQDIWVKSLKCRAQRLGLDMVVLSDVRFLNEWEHFKEPGNALILIERPQAHRCSTHSLELKRPSLRATIGAKIDQILERYLPKEPMDQGHSSEVTIDTPEFHKMVSGTIQNDRDIENLLSKAVGIIDRAGYECPKGTI